MRISLLIVVLFLCTGCVSRGYVPHYILTDSPETKKAMQQCQEEPREIAPGVILEAPALESPK